MNSNSNSESLNQLTDKVLLQSLAIISYSTLLMTTVGVYIIRNVLKLDTRILKFVERSATYILGIVWTLLLISTSIQLYITLH